MISYCLKYNIYRYFSSTVIPHYYALSSCEKQSLHCFPSDPNIRKVPDFVSKNLVLCLPHFTMDLFTNKAQFNAGFLERLKIKNDVVLNILDPTVKSHHTSMRNCFH